MIRRLFLILAAGFVFVALAPPARADIITFDENGNGTWTDLFDNVTPLTGFTAADPTGGITTGSVLIYTLPFTFAVAAGDVRIWEDSAMTQLGDLVRFSDASGDFDPNTSSGAIQFILYSALGGVDLADVDLPTNIIPNDLGGVVETGGIFSFGDPSSILYQGTSDVPEPGTLLLVASGVAALVCSSCRKKR